jgi:hypothetical protein
MVIYYGVEDFQILLLFEVKNLAKKIKNSITSIGRPTCVGQMSTTAMVFTFLPTTTIPIKISCRPLHSLTHSSIIKPYLIIPILLTSNSLPFTFFQANTK